MSEQTKEELQVSADTLRRDLADLEKQGLAQKNHGGAIALDISAMNRQGRNALLPQTKQRLGRLVASKIPAGSTLFVRAGRAATRRRRGRPGRPWTSAPW